MRKWLAAVVLPALFAVEGVPGAAGAGGPDSPAIPLEIAGANSQARSMVSAPAAFQGIFALTFYALGPVDLLVTDPQGRRVGVDPASGEVIQEIPEAYYFGLSAAYEGRELEIVSIYGPLDGDYTLLVVGTGAGRFDLTIENSSTRSGEVVLRDMGDVSPGQTFEYTVAGKLRPPAEPEIDYALPVMKEAGEWNSVLRLHNPGETLARVRLSLYDGRGNLKFGASAEKKG